MLGLLSFVSRRNIWRRECTSIAIALRRCGPRICEGDPSAGPIAQLSRRERFHWLVSPRSTIIQSSPVHTGLCHATDVLLDRLQKQFLT
jgi:hypothetical protein